MTETTIDSAPAIEIEHLTFSYGDGADARVVFSDLSLSVAVGTRCLLLGANGVGKTTLLRIAAGRHMLPASKARVLGRSAFHDTTLAAEVAFIGGAFPFAADISVGEILRRRPGVEPRRRAAVLDMLDIDQAWRMNRVSDGQRRRVQLLLDLERRLRVILLDEVTAELDVLARADLLRFLRVESEQHGVTIVYASHVLEGLQQFGTHLLFLSPGRMRCLAPLAEVPELAASQRESSTGAVSPLHHLCERWMAEDRAVVRSRIAAVAERPSP